MNYRKTVTLTIVGILCFILFLVTFLYCCPRISLLSQNTLTATVTSPDSDGTSGFAILKVTIPREDGGTVFFHYYYPGNSSRLKQGEEVLVSGNIVFMDQSTESGVNEGLIIGTKTPVIVCLILLLIGVLGAIVILPMMIRNFIHKPWKNAETPVIKPKTIHYLYTAEIFALVIAMVLFVVNISQAIGYWSMKEHTTGVVTYQSSRQSSQFIKTYTGDRLYHLKSIFGKGIRPYYSVLQIKADAPVNGVDEFWYEGNNLVLGNQKVYIGFDGGAIAVLSGTECMLLLISGGFLLFHTVSAVLLHRKNKYGGKLFWFFRF